jgi:Zn-dependent peptidase ImmA (M78 family)/transcriptional regulator with XRE-family HTH domain
VSASQERIPVEPAVITWARIRAGYRETDLAAQRLSVSEATLRAWESGEKQPTIKQLRTMTRVYHRPLAVLLLPEPPKEFDPISDFRTMAPGRPRQWSPALTASVQRADSQRETFLEIAELAPAVVQETSEPWRLPAGNTETQAGYARRALGMATWPPAIWRDANKALNAAIDAVERMGMLVIHTQDVSTSEMRGLSISKWPFPVIALNGSDLPRPRLFTLLHELCHIGLNSGGLCDLHETRGKAHHTDNDEREHSCNQFAAAVLMPERLLLAQASVRGSDETKVWTPDELRELGLSFGAGSEATLLRLISVRKATWDTYWIVKPRLDELYEQFRREQKTRQREGAGGPNYYTIKARDLGHGYVNTVLTAFDNRTISSLDVTDYLGVRFDQIDRLGRAVRR